MTDSTVIKSRTVYVYVYVHRISRRYRQKPHLPFGAVSAANRFGPLQDSPPAQVLGEMHDPRTPARTVLHAYMHPPIRLRGEPGAVLQPPFEYLCCPSARKANGHLHLQSATKKKNGLFNVLRTRVHFSSRFPAHQNNFTAGNSCTLYSHLHQ